MTSYHETIGESMSAKKVKVYNSFDDWAAGHMTEVTVKVPKKPKKGKKHENKND